MKRLIAIGLPAAAVVLGLAAAARPADESPSVVEQINQKMVKVFGSGGVKGIPAFGTGVLVSPDGYVLTVNTQMLDTPDLRIHMPNGNKFSHCKVVAAEPELDVALVKIEFGDQKPDAPLPYFDVAEAVKQPMLEVGDSIYAFSNAFEIAQRDDWVTVQHGTVSALSKLQGRNGFYEMRFPGKVYVVDAITNNPGAAGGALTTRKGELVGLVGRGLRNELSNTWAHYSIPINASVVIPQPDGKPLTRTILDLIELKEKYKPVTDPSTIAGGGDDTYSGLILVANPVDITPPYVEDVEPNSPAAKAGFKADDLIVYVGGASVKTINSFKEMMKHYHPNQEVKIEVRRGDKFSTLDMTLAPPKNPPRKPVTPPPAPTDK
jgi:serine protease Do